MKKVKILLVCSANICRSPLAQGLLVRLLESEGLIKQCRVESAGTMVLQAGSKPDQRAINVANQHDLDIGRIRARKVRKSDFSSYDYIVAMDEQNLKILEQDCPDEYEGRLSLITDFSQELGETGVPDPYFGNPAGFRRVFDMLDVACKGLLGRIRRDLA